MEKEKLIAKLEEEFESLQKKVDTLIAFLNTEDLEEKVGETQANLLFNQECAMQLYLSILAMRIDDLQKSIDEEKKPAEDAEEKEEMLDFIKNFYAILSKHASKK